MFKKINPNPQNNSDGDCTIRAISLALGKTWYETYIDLCIQGLIMARMPSSNKTWMQYLKDHGWKRYTIPDDCPECYTIGDFCGEFFRGTYLVGTGSHLVCVKDGCVLDTWDSRSEVPIFYWKESK